MVLRVHCVLLGATFATRSSLYFLGALFLTRDCVFLVLCSPFQLIFWSGAVFAIWVRFFLGLCSPPEFFVFSSGSVRHPGLLFS